MPSLLPGFEYDIFISYRHKDNKYDGWVSEFVANLRKELEATFKEDVSIYFDENPHDGLLETHDVDKSLEGKLKCLVFIPILSQTYCDPKSFAWKHELLAFRDQAATDQLGLVLKLMNGNAASRILPVRIHDLDTTDKQLFEKETKGTLRSIDFTFKVAGVNRPLRSKDDDVKEITHTFFYRDQINKVANAVKELVLCCTPGPHKGAMGDASHTHHKHQLKGPSIFDERKYTRHPFGKSAKRKLGQVLLISLTVAFAVLALWGWLRQDSNTSARAATYSKIALESYLVDIVGQFPNFAISHDGRTIAYSTINGIVVRPLSGFTSSLLEGTQRAGQLVFSPDGKSMAFTKDRQIYTIALSGANMSLLANISGAGLGLYWGHDERVYYSPGLGTEGIWRVSDHGRPEQLTVVKDSLGETAHAWPQLLPDGKSLLYTALGPSGGHLDSRIMMLDVASHKSTPLIEQAFFGRYLSNGFLLSATNDGVLSLQKFDLTSNILRGQPTAMLSSVCTSTWGGAAYVAVSDNGNVLFLPRESKPINALYTVDRSGRILSGDSIPINVLEKMGHGWSGLNISPGGEFMAVNGRSFGRLDIWLLNLVSRDTERITFDVAEEEFPVWSPAGDSIVYTAANTGNSRRLYIKNIRNRSDPRLIRKWPRHIHFSSWSPDNKWLAAYEYGETNGMNILAINRETAEAISIAESPANESDARFSPNGQWLAYHSDESGRNEVYVVSFPDLKSKRQISIDGGDLPRWDPSGNTLYYRSNGYITAQPVQLTENFKRGNPTSLFHANAIDFNISPDGKKFYIVKRFQKEEPYLSLITDWFEELKEKTSR